MENAEVGGLIKSSAIVIIPRSIYSGSNNYLIPCWFCRCSFFLRMFQKVDLATPNVFVISLIGLFWFFSLMMACFTDSDSSLDLILRVDSNRFQMQITHLKWTLVDILSAPCKLDNEGITHTWPWNSWAANCPITFGPLKSGRHI